MLRAVAGPSRASIRLGRRTRNDMAKDDHGNDDGPPPKRQRGKPPVIELAATEIEAPQAARAPEPEPAAAPEPERTPEPERPVPGKAWFGVFDRRAVRFAASIGVAALAGALIAVSVVLVFERGADTRLAKLAGEAAQLNARVEALASRPADGTAAALGERMDRVSASLADVERRLAAGARHDTPLYISARAAGRGRAILVGAHRGAGAARRPRGTACCARARRRQRVADHRSAHAPVLGACTAADAGVGTHKWLYRPAGAQRKKSRGRAARGRGACWGRCGVGGGARAGAARSRRSRRCDRRGGEIAGVRRRRGRRMAQDGKAAPRRGCGAEGADRHLARLPCGGGWPAVIRIILFLAFVALIAFGAAWVADRPGAVVLTWQGWQISTSLAVAGIVFAATIVLAIFLWSALRFVLHIPDLVAVFRRERRARRGWRALSQGMIGVGAGTLAAAQRSARGARALIGEEPLTLLLAAQAAQLGGDSARAEQEFRAMLARPETKVLGLRGLYVEARRRADAPAARAFAEEAAETGPVLPWAAGAQPAFP